MPDFFANGRFIVNLEYITYCEIVTVNGVKTFRVHIQSSKDFYIDFTDERVWQWIMGHGTRIGE